MKTRKVKKTKKTCYFETLPSNVRLNIKSHLNFNDHKKIQLTSQFFYYRDNDQLPQIFRTGEGVIYQLILGKVSVAKDNRGFVPVTFNKPIIDILPGYDHVIFKDRDGQFYISGTNYCRELVKEKEEIKAALPIITKIKDQAITHIIPGYRRNFIRTANNIWYGCGANNHGELGMGKYSSRHAIAHYLFQIILPDNEQIKWVTTGKYNTFFLTQNGKWYCSGSAETIGVLKAYPNNTHKPIPFQLDEHSIIKILLGDDFGILLNNRGELYGWGTDQYSQLDTASIEPTRIHTSNIKKIITITIANNQLFICDQSGTWYSREKINRETSSNIQRTFESINYQHLNEEFSKYKQFYEPSTQGALRFLPPEITVTNVYEKLQFQHLKKLRLTSRFFSHDNHHLLEETMNRPQIFCTGNGSIYALFKYKVYKFEENKFIPITSRREKLIIDIKTGYDHIILKDINGAFYIKGLNYCPALVNSQADDKEIFSIINKTNTDEKITDIIPGYNRNFVRTIDNNWYAAGENYHGELGMGKYSSRHQIAHYLMNVALPDNQKIKFIIPGKNNTFFQAQNGKWYCCGSAKSIGMLGVYPNNANSPILFQLGEHVIIKIVSDNDLSLLLTDQGELYGWGDCQNNEVILPSTTPKPIAHHLGKITDVVIINRQLFVRDQHGTWHSRGINDKGQLGLSIQGAPFASFHPIILKNNKTIIRIIGGENTTLFLDEAGNWHGCGMIGNEKKVIPAMFDMNFIPVKENSTSLKK